MPIEFLVRGSNGTEQIIVLSSGDQTNTATLCLDSPVEHIAFDPRVQILHKGQTRNDAEYVPAALICGSTDPQADTPHSTDTGTGEALNHPKAAQKGCSCQTGGAPYSWLVSLMAVVVLAVRRKPKLSGQSPQPQTVPRSR